MDCNDLKKRVVKSLAGVIDPETGINVLSMDLIKEINVTEDGDVSLVFSPSSPVCPLGFRLAFEIRKSIVQTKGVKGIDMRVENFIYADKLNAILAEIGSDAKRGINNRGRI